MALELNDPFYTEDEALFARTVRAFYDKEMDGKLLDLEAAGGEDRAFWAKAAEAGLVGVAIPEEYGGPGASPIFNVILSYELGRSIGYGTIGGNIATDLATMIVMEGGTEAQKHALAPRILSGAIQCMALTEPDAGSDAAAIKTVARRDGDDYVISGSKVYISNGLKADLLYIVAKTDPAAGLRGMTIILVEGDAPGLSRHRLKTMAFPAGGVASLFLDEVRVPVSNRIGEEGGAVALLSKTLAVDRLQTGARALGQAEIAFEMTLDYTRQRKVQGKPLFDLQHTKMKLAEMKTDIAVGRSLFFDHLGRMRGGAYSTVDAAISKNWLCKMSAAVLDQCVQLYGGAGFMDEMPISRLYTANRQFRFVAGTEELLNLQIARSL